MTDTSVTGLCHLTVRAPARTIDLAVPSDVPVADLLPTVLRYAGRRPRRPVSNTTAGSSSASAAGPSTRRRPSPPSG